MLLTMLINYWLMLQESLPDFYLQLFNEKTLSAVMMIVGAVKLIRNAINVKGIVAVVVTFAVSLAYGLFQFGFGGEGTLFGLTVGLLSAGSFYLTKNIGSVLAATLGLGDIDGKMRLTLRTSFVQLVAFFQENPNFLKGLGKVLNYIFLRK